MRRLTTRFKTREEHCAVMCIAQGTKDIAQRRLNRALGWQWQRWLQGSSRDTYVCWSSFYFCFFCFLGLHLPHMEVPRRGVKSELQLPACATATATRELSCVCNLHHSSWQCWILNPLSEARDWTHILVHNIRVCDPLSHNGNSLFALLKKGRCNLVQI